MDTLEIYKCLKKITHRTKAQFTVIPCDMLENLKIYQYPLLLCVNNKGSDHEGEHWLGIYIKRKGSEVEFYDSYGMGMEFYDKAFIQFAVKQNATVLENRVAVQGINQNSCGHFVIYFLQNRLIGCPRHTLYCRFSKDFVKNDKIVRRFVSRISIRSVKCNMQGKIIQCCKCKNDALKG